MEPCKHTVVSIPWNTTANCQSHNTERPERKLVEHTQEKTQRQSRRKAKSEIVIMPLSNKVTIIIEGRVEIIALKEDTRRIFLPRCYLAESRRPRTHGAVRGCTLKSSTCSWVGARQWWTTDCCESFKVWSPRGTSSAEKGNPKNNHSGREGGRQRHHRRVHQDSKPVSPFCVFTYVWGCHTESPANSLREVSSSGVGAR